MTDLIDKPDNTDNKPKYGSLCFYSDRIKWIVIGLFLIALIFKNRHWPGAGIMMIACGGISVLMIIGQLIEGRKYKNYTKAIFGVSIALSMIYLVFRFQYWSGGNFVFGFAIVTGFGTAIYLGLKQRKREFNNLAMSLICLGIFIFALPNSKIFYYTNMSKTLNEWEHYNSAYAWQRYGDFLKAEGDQKGAGMAYLKSFTCASREEGGEIYQEILDEIIGE